MPPSASPRTDWSRLSVVIAETMGVDFPRHRWSELQHRMARAEKEFGFADTAACVDWLLSAPLNKAQVEVLARCLTVGETYFFRERKTLDVFSNTLLPELIFRRRGQQQQLRLWSAACCSGEEAYSLAMLLRRGLPDFADWKVKILATDINRHFLEQAAAGLYSEWSCRHVPADFRERYLERRADGRYAVAREIRDMVSFAPLNLVEDTYPARATDTDEMDMIFCRNVLIYFTPANIRKVAEKFHRALGDGGWLAVSPVEAVAETFPQFAVSNFPGAILFHKGAAKPGNSRMAARAPPVQPKPVLQAPRRAPETTAAMLARPPPPPAGAPTAPIAATRASSHATATALLDQGRHSEAIDVLLALATQQTNNLPQVSLLARALANQGRVAEALTWCDLWIAADKLDAKAHYLRAVIQLELADQEQARHSLQRAIYLQPDLVVAHFALGSLARSRGRRHEAGRHFSNTQHLLAGLPPTSLLPESDGLTAGRLVEAIAALEPLEISQ